MSEHLFLGNSMKPEHTKPFDLNSAKAGAPYAQRNGLAARIGIWDSTNSNGYALVGTLIHRNGDEGSAAWQANGDCFNNTRDSELVMLPLGYCQSKPVFVGDELVVKVGYSGKRDKLTIKPDCWQNQFDAYEWPSTAPAPVMPIFFALSDQQQRAVEYALICDRSKIEAYWKQLDEFNGVTK
jgi:hypothetical protein